MSGPTPRHDSVSFDRAADYYDATRITDPVALERSIDLLEGELAGRGTILETGVGTGAIALPLHERGISLAGADLSEPMLRRLIVKAGDAPPFPLVQADATRLPFGDDAFGGAYLRWVLHLIPGWRDAVSELVRVVVPGGHVVIEPGGYQGGWRDLWLRFVEELGPDAEAVGLNMRHGATDLDAALLAHGARLADTPLITGPDHSSIERWFDEVRRRLYSWTWRVPDDRLQSAIEAVQPWAKERFGALDGPPEPEHRLAWRIYEFGP
ncbi:MAG: class I SAM-dependent methyltransferase [Actinomycetota bacterium]